jgi:triosephosphate isomerase
MNTSAEECVALCNALRDSVGDVANVEVSVCPPFMFLADAKEALSGSGIRVGAQNVHWEEQGAYTGEISPTMLQGIVDDVIIGHSERRQYFGETDATVNQRVQAALAHNLRPIVCIGETHQERESGNTNDVLSRQVRVGLEAVAWTPDSVVAYEPIWAIGTGLAASASQANETISFIRGLLGDVFGSSLADSTRIQYGGSVKPDNAADYFGQPNIDGALVGGASLDANAFAAIVAAARAS